MTVEKSWFYHIAYHELMLLSHARKVPDLEHVKIQCNNSVGAKSTRVIL
jgi:hypothetical protein